jgi:hypothetical protein
MSGRENGVYDVTGPHVQTGSGGQAFVLRLKSWNESPLAINPLDGMSI